MSTYILAGGTAGIDSLLYLLERHADVTQVVTIDRFEGGPSVSGRLRQERVIEETIESMKAFREELRRFADLMKPARRQLEPRPVPSNRPVDLSIARRAQRVARRARSGLPRKFRYYQGNF